MQKPEIGQEVVVCKSGNFETHYYFGYVVTKISPKGNITIAQKDNPEHTRIFNVRGEERSTIYSKYDRPWIELDVQRIREVIAQRRRTTDAIAAVSKIRADDISRRWNKEHLQEEIARLEQLLDEAKKKVDEI
jgi:hypothetical protein